VNKSEYLKLTIEQQISYINKKMNEGKSLNATCREIPLTKSTVTAKFRKHGYKLFENQYVPKVISDHESLNRNSEELELDEIVAEEQNEKEPEDKSILQSKESTEKQLDEAKSEAANIGSNRKKSSKTEESIKKEKKTKSKSPVGRPQKYKKDHAGKNIDKKKFTLEIDKKVYKALKRKKIEEKIAINIYVEDLLRRTIEDKYFKNPVD